MGLLRAQGATEYLVLLAVVLVIALVGIALLGFFPGVASDAQEQESKIYWQSATPIAIIEMDAKYYASDTHPYFRLRNTGAYPVRITKMLGGNAQSISVFYSGAGNANMSDEYYMAPGEEKWSGNWNAFSGLPGVKGIVIRASGTSATYYLYAASSLCTATGTQSNGVLTVKDFGFEYVQYVEGQQITKRQIGTKPLIIGCS